MEPLEARQLLSGVSLNSDGVLIVSGPDGQANTLTVSRNASGSYIARSNSITRTYAASDVHGIEIYGGDGADTITVDASVAMGVYVDARYGDDRVSVGSGNDTVWGDYGNPTDENASEVPTDGHVGPPSDDPLIHTDPDTDGVDATVGLELHDLQTSIHGGDFVDPNDPLFGDQNVPAGDHGDTSPYEHDTGGADSAFDDDGLP